jgi:hypothetical protein
MEAQWRVSQLLKPEHGEVFAWGSAVRSLPDKHYNVSAPAITLAVERWGVPSYIAENLPAGLVKGHFNDYTPVTYKMFEFTLDDIPKPVVLHLVDDLKAFKAVWKSIPSSLYWEIFAEYTLKSYQMFDAITGAYYRGKDDVTFPTTNAEVVVDRQPVPLAILNAAGGVAPF